MKRQAYIDFIRDTIICCYDLGQVKTIDTNMNLSKFKGEERIMNIILGIGVKIDGIIIEEVATYSLSVKYKVTNTVFGYETEFLLRTGTNRSPDEIFQTFDYTVRRTAFEQLLNNNHRDLLKPVYPKITLPEGWGVKDKE